MTAAAPFFIDGGSLPTDAPSYVERPADRTLYERVKRGELCYLLTPRRSGKSSLLLRLRERLRQEGMKVAFVDLTMVGLTDSGDQWFYGFCYSIARELALTVAFESWWPQHLALPATQRMTECLRYFFLQQFAEPLLILVDEIENTRKLAFGDDFLAALRACFNARAQDSEYARLNFVLAGLSTPADLIKDPARTPFNVGSRVELTDFTMAEADGLIVGLRDRCPEPKRVLERILDWTSGHPYLTQRLCKAASERLTRPGETDALVELELLSEQGRGKEDHFKFVRERVLGADRARAVLTLYGRVLRGPRVEADTRSPVHDALRLSDLVRIETDGTLAPRNRILETVFDRTFVRRALRWSRQTFAVAASISLTVLTAIVFVFGVLPRNYLQAIDVADQDPPNLEYRKLHSIPGWGSVADEHLAHYFDRRAMIAAQNGDRDRALLNSLHADSISPKPRRRAQAAALITEDLVSLERTFRCAGEVKAVAFSPHGERVLTGCDDSTAQLWNLRSGQPIGAPMKHKDSVNAVAFSPDGNQVLTGSDDKTARLWDAHTGQPLGAPLQHKDQVVVVTFSRDGAQILTGSVDRTARIWDARTGLEVGVPMKHQGPVLALALSPQGERALTGSGDKTARLWDAHTGLPIGTPMRHQGSVFAVAFSANGQRTLTGSHENTAHLWDANTGLPVGAPMKHQGLLFAVAFSPDGERVLTGGFDGTARLWSARNGKAIGVPMDVPDSVDVLAFSPNGNCILTGSRDGTAQLWDARSGKPLGVPLMQLGSITAVAFSPNGDHVLTGGRDGTIRLWDLRVMQPAVSILWHPGLVIGSALSSDGRRVLTGGNDNTARLWDLRTGQLVGAPMKHQGAVTALALSPDGQRALTGSGDKTARLWDARTGQPIGAPMKHRDGVIAVAFSPNGDHALTGSLDGTARLWDALTGQPVGVPMKHQDAINAVAFSPNGDLVLTGSFDGTARLWDALTGQPVGVPMQHQDGVIAVAFSPNGDRVLTGSAAETAQIWDARTGQRVGDPMTHQDTVNTVAFSWDGNSAWTFAGPFGYQWLLSSPGTSPTSTISMAGPMSWRPRGVRIDPSTSYRIQVVSPIGSAAIVRTFDLSAPAGEFNQQATDLLRKFEKKLGLKFRADGQAVVPYPLPSEAKERRTKSRQ